MGRARAEQVAGHDGGTRHEGARRGGGQVKEQSRSEGMARGQKRVEGIGQTREWHVRAGQGIACINRAGRGRYSTAQQEQGQIQRRAGQWQGQGQEQG